MANILLIQPKLNWDHPWCEAPSTALLILGSVAKNKGHKIKIMHLDIDDGDLAAEIKSFKPEIVGVTINTFHTKSAKEVTREVRKVSKDIKLVVGGPHASVWDGDADEIVVGEGENEWLRILGDGHIEDINEIPPIDYSLVDLCRFTGVSPLIGAVPSMCIMASRGCSGKCTFCNTPVFWGTKHRYREPQHIVEEIEQLHNIYGVNEIFFQDDTFNIKHKWAFQVFEGIISKGLNKKMVFRMTGRVNEKLVTKDYLDLAKRAGVWNIFYGIESGSQYMLDRMKKDVRLDEIKRAIKMTHDVGIKTVCSFIVGLPGETWDTLRETDELISEIKPYHYGWAYACPFPCTEFEWEVKEKGYIRHRDYENYTYGMLIVRTDKLDYRDLASFKGFNYKGA